MLSNLDPSLHLLDDFGRAIVLAEYEQYQFQARSSKIRNEEFTCVERILFRLLLFELFPGAVRLGVPRNQNQSIICSLCKF